MRPAAAVCPVQTRSKPDMPQPVQEESHPSYDCVHLPLWDRPSQGRDSLQPRCPCITPDFCSRTQGPMNCRALGSFK